jgi:hypothetical protein
MPPGATEMFRHHLLLIDLFCATPASYWSVGGINTNSTLQPVSRQSVQFVANIPTVGTCETNSINMFSKRPARRFIGTVAWDPFCFSKNLNRAPFQKVETIETLREPPEFSSFPGRCWQLTLACRAILFYLFCTLKGECIIFYHIKSEFPDNWLFCTFYLGGLGSEVLLTL